MGPWTRGALLALMLSIAVGAPNAERVAAREQDPELDRLYGRVLTSDGARYEGYLRWDRNEAAWTDYLDGAKEIPQEFIREAESLDPDFAAAQKKARSIVAFGTRISWDVDDEGSALISDSGIRFGHVASLTVLDGRRALLELHGGGEVTLRSSSTDLGNSMRGLVVEQPGTDPIQVRWRDLDRIEFLDIPATAPSPSSDRIHGTVTTWDDLELTGYISWDVDEILGEDILDGRQGGDDYEIAFSGIAAIEWESSRSSRVVLRSGEELVLRGTNDVDRNNRGVEVSDAGFGRAIVQWEGFKALRLHAPESAYARPGYEGGAELQGTVYAVDGREIEGSIRWDNEETYAWESLDGWGGDVDFSIEFGAISSIDKIAPDRVTVTLFDGRTLELEDQDDVAEGNRGIFVKPDGRARRLVRWQDFDRLVFAR